MIVQVNKPQRPVTKWTDIISGDVFSWGEQNFWYVKVNASHYVAIGSASGLVLVGDLTHCSTLVVAQRVEITP